jgi:hypothetical protein
MDFLLVEVKIKTILKFEENSKFYICKFRVFNVLENFKIIIFIIYNSISF